MRIGESEPTRGKAFGSRTTGCRSRSQSNVSSASPSESLNSIVTRWRSSDDLAAAKGSIADITPRRLRTVASIPTRGSVVGRVAALGGSGAVEFFVTKSSSPSGVAKFRELYSSRRPVDRHVSTPLCQRRSWSALPFRGSASILLAVIHSHASRDAADEFGRYVVAVGFQHKPPNLAHGQACRRRGVRCMSPFRRLDWQNVAACPRPCVYPTGDQLRSALFVCGRAPKTAECLACAGAHLGDVSDSLARSRAPPRTAHFTMAWRCNAPAARDYL
jgi:hypothetical protein